MDPITGNLTAQERAGLQPGTEVVVKSGEHKTVRGYNAGQQMLVFEEGGPRHDNEHVRLASFTPAPAGECAECARLRGVVTDMCNERRVLHEEGMATQARLTEALAEVADKILTIANLKADIRALEEQIAARPTPAELAIAELGRIGRGL